MRIPLEYGDNFPVPTGGWSPAVPWRFPKPEKVRGISGWIPRILPWLTLGLGMTLGVLWMKGQAADPVQPAPFQQEPAADTGRLHPSDSRQPVPARPVRLRSRLA